MLVSAHGLTVFCLVYLLAVATPGPGIAATIARALARGTAGLPAFIAGFVVGDLAWFTCAATGMAALAQSAHGLFLAVKYLGALYLLYLAIRMWTAPAHAVATQTEVVGGAGALRVFAGALVLTLGNPKAMVLSGLATHGDRPAGNDTERLCADRSGDYPDLVGGADDLCSRRGAGPPDFPQRAGNKMA
jgi:threonine/homoserine/homoserine lactone efflux protein